jgi:hypothetical protein
VPVKVATGVEATGFTTGAVTGTLPALPTVTLLGLFGGAATTGLETEP